MTKQRTKIIEKTRQMYIELNHIKEAASYLETLINDLRNALRQKEWREKE